jgi:hypothetical protein
MQRGEKLLLLRLVLVLTLGAARLSFALNPSSITKNNTQLFPEPTSGQKASQQAWNISAPEQLCAALQFVDFKLASPASLEVYDGPTPPAPSSLCEHLGFLHDHCGGCKQLCAHEQRQQPVCGVGTDEHKLVRFVLPTVFQCHRPLSPLRRLLAQPLHHS